MDVDTLIKIFVTAMFSPPGIANFVISTLLKKRIHATAAAFVAAAAMIFMNNKVLSQIGLGQYAVIVILTVIAMMIAAHLGFTIGTKVIRAKK
ncbi:hypothetical protein [uncultured Cohaesibacter sp.]|uniref:hypothetical protein n=1 Tax=uncultured Cohaesibacter sp. TaxID=1002546 RepID=UPI0029309A84|nr:hypothetical protein [uncultured Cohaesibacter sp.]